MAPRRSSGEPGKTEVDPRLEPFIEALADLLATVVLRDLAEGKIKPAKSEESRAQKAAVGTT